MMEYGNPTNLNFLRFQHQTDFLVFLYRLVVIILMRMDSNILAITRIISEMFMYREFGVMLLIKIVQLQDKHKEKDIGFVFQQQMDFQHVLIAVMVHLQHCVHIYHLSLVL